MINRIFNKNFAKGFFLFALVFAVSLTLYRSATATDPSPVDPAGDCSNAAAVLSGRILYDGSQGGGALGRVTNNSNCSFNIGLDVFKSDGTNFDAVPGVIGPWQTQDLHASVPLCGYRVELSTDATILDTRTVGSGNCPAPPPTFVNLNFMVKDICTNNPVIGAGVSIGQDFGNGASRNTDGSGFVNFGVYANTDVSWSVSAGGYSASSGAINSGGGQTVNVTLSRTCGTPPTPPPTLISTPTPNPPQAPNPAPTPTPTPTPTPPTPTPPGPTPTPTPTPTPPTPTPPGPTPTPTPTPTPPTPTPTPGGGGGGGGGGGNSGGLLQITKLVRDVTTNSAQTKSVNANSGDTVEFLIQVTPNGSNFTFNTRVGDSLPAGLAYVPGSSTIDNAFLSDGITTTGVNLGTVYPSRLVSIRFRATVNVAQTGTSTTLTNIASAFADNAATATDNALVVIGTAPVPQTFTIQKFGRNISAGDTVNQASFTAKAGDTVEFDLVVTAPVNAGLTNVVVNDALPLGLTYVPNSTALNNILAGEGIAGAGLNIGSLAAGQQATLRFFTTVNPGLAAGQVLTNTATARADNAGPVNSQPVYVTIVSRGVVLGALRVRTGSGDSTAALAGIGGLISSLVYYFFRRQGLVVKI